MFFLPKVDAQPLQWLKVILHGRSEVHKRPNNN